jgi:hypothetical protein
LSTIFRGNPGTGEINRGFAFVKKNSFCENCGFIEKHLVYYCAAKALFSCPAIISQRLESRIISKEPQENTEEESKII